MGRWASVLTDDEPEPERFEPLADDELLHTRLDLLMRSYGPPPPPALGERGACRGLSVAQRDELFFYEGADAKFVNKRTIEGWCNRCEVKAECLAYAMSIPKMEGIWGGTTSFERECIRQPGLRAARAVRAQAAKARDNAAAQRRQEREAERLRRLQKADEDRQAVLAERARRRAERERKRDERLAHRVAHPPKRGRPAGSPIQMRMRYRNREVYFSLTVRTDTSQKFEVASVVGWADAAEKARARLADRPDLLRALDAALKANDMQPSLDEGNTAA